MNTDKAYADGYDGLRDANMEPTVCIIKRNGSSEAFTPVKIRTAIEKANAEEKRERCQLSESQIDEIVDTVSSIIFRTERPMSVEEIQDVVEREICARSYEVFLLFHDYRHKQTEKRSLSDVDRKIEGVTEVAVDRTGNVTVRNEEASTENSNKNVTIISTQRDYMAGEWSRYYTNKYLLPDDIRKAHEEGIIHFHDSDYFANLMTNCCLINLEDMLQNGTCISGTKIDPPRSFITACTVTSQISAAVASSQYGGQTITLSHLAPFVDVSRQKLKKRFREELPQLSESELNAFVEKEVRKEVEAGCQTIQYQEITLSSTNGQAPFITIFMYLDEVPEGQTRDDLALIIETMLRQRIKGVKDRTGHYVSPAFPKLIYALDEDNIHEDSTYYYLTELAAKCTAKRLVPDYVSVKKMKELKGDVYPPMGCVDGKEVIDYKVNGTRYVESFERAWSRLTKLYEIKTQPNGLDLYIDTDDVEILDMKKGYVKNLRMIRNSSDKWLKITFSLGYSLVCTTDHPFETENRGVVLAEDLTEDDVIMSERGEIHPVSTRAYEKRDFSYDVTTESEHFTVSGIYSHNCRSFLTPDTFTDAGLGNVANAGNYDAHKHKYYGRFNQGVVTINLVDVACSSKKDMKKFFEILDERLELCHRALRLRHERLLGTPSDVAPILWQDGAYARLKPGETIDKLLYNGYSTISLGYAGIAEMTYYMLGVSHTTDEGKAFALEVMQRLNDACTRWKEAENIAYSVYGTPLESTTYKFAKCLRRRFGVIEHVTDKDYITNSFHVHVTEPIDAFTKLSLEAEFQHLSPGGVVNYVEVPNLQDNLLAVLEVMKHIYETNVYAELNTKSDFCEKCGYDGEIQIVKDEETGKLVWECPNCGNRNQSTMHVTRRTCGYIGTQYWNQGRTAEIADRVLHL